MRLFLIIVAAIVTATVVLCALPFAVLGLASWFPDYCGQTHELVKLNYGRDVSFGNIDCLSTPDRVAGDGYFLLSGEFTTKYNGPMHYIVMIKKATSDEKWSFTDFKFFTQAQWDAVGAK